MDILVKPMQRITKYSLLLKAIQKHTDAEEHKNKLDQMVNIYERGSRAQYLRRRGE